MSTLVNQDLPYDIETKEMSAEALAFVQANKERLDHIADEHLWLSENFSPLIDKDIPRNEGWYVSVSRERYERIKEAE